MTPAEAQLVYQALLRRIRRAVGHTHRNGRTTNALGKSWRTREPSDLKTFWQALHDEVEGELLWEMRIYDALKHAGHEELALRRLNTNYEEEKQHE